MMTWLTAKLASPLIRYGLIAVGVILLLSAIVGGALWYVGSVRKDGEKTGATRVESEVKTNTIIIQREITRAEQAKPRTRRSVADELRAGTF